MENKNKIIKAGLLGYPLDYSISPVIHNFLFEQAGRKGEYREFRIKPDSFDQRILNILKETPYLNVTIPYKKRIIEHLQGTADNARILGVVNTISNELGYNTDGTGLKTALADWDVPESVMIIGAGNTSRTALYSILEMQVKHIFFIHRNSLSLQKLKNELDQTIFVEVDTPNTFVVPNTDQKITFYNDAEEILKHEEKIDLLINTTPGGMYPNIDSLPIDEAIIHHILTKLKPHVFDVIYNPVKTKLLKMAEKNELEYKNGLAMLFHQAYASQTIWFEEEYSKTKANKLWLDFQKKLEPEKLIQEHWPLDANN